VDPDRYTRWQLAPAFATSQGLSARAPANLTAATASATRGQGLATAEARWRRRNGPAGHVLLIPHVLVGGQEDLKARVLSHIGLCCREQRRML
jgi:hypothetical protein